MMESIRDEFLQAAKVLDNFIASSGFNNIEAAGNLLVESFQNKHKAISCGNGGSMCDAMHFAEELSGKFRNDRPALPAMAISDPSFITCAANDFGFDNVFSRYIEAFGSEGDVLLAISTSGNSKNILEAADMARMKKMKVISLTGKDGGKLAALSNIEIRVPHNGYADRIQEVHIKIIHTLILFVESRMFPDLKQ